MMDRGRSAPAAARALGILPAALCLLLAGCAGLPAAREMGDMALLRTMGVDARGEELAVTASAGQAEAGEPALVVSARRESLSAACLAMQGQSDRYVFFGHVDQLLLGEGLARQGVRPVLDYFAQNVELSLGARLWLIRGTEAGRAVASGGEKGVDARLATLQNDGKLGAAPRTRTVGEVYTDLLERGSAFVPALTLAEDTLTEYGYGVFRGDRLAGALEGEAARGLELLAGQLTAEIVEEEQEGNRISVRLNSARVRSVLEFQGETPAVLRVSCQVKGRLEEYQRPVTAAEREELDARLEEQLRKSGESALACLQEWQADCTGLGPRAALLCPGRWQAVREDWPSWFAQVPVELRVQVTIQD